MNLLVLELQQSIYIYTPKHHQTKTSLKCQIFKRRRVSFWALIELLLLQFEWPFSRPLLSIPQYGEQLPTKKPLDHVPICVPWTKGRLCVSSEAAKQQTCRLLLVSSEAIRQVEKYPLVWVSQVFHRSASCSSARRSTTQPPEIKTFTSTGTL